MSSAWSTFFSTQVSASAALAGLVLVAVSINLTYILEAYPLANRAFEALSTLFVVLVVSSLVLIPQSLSLLGREILLIGLATWLVNLRLHLGYWRDGGSKYALKNLGLAVLGRRQLFPSSWARSSSSVSMVPGSIFSQQARSAVWRWR